MRERIVVTQSPFDLFFGRFLEETNYPVSLFIISPWITMVEEDPITSTRILERIKRDRVRTVVVMRPPELEPENLLFNNHLIELDLPWLELDYNRVLHAKLYCCRARPYDFAYVGSANFTAAARTNIEVGLFIRGLGDETALVNAIFHRCSLIRGQNMGTVKVKPFGHLRSQR